MKINFPFIRHLKFRLYVYLIVLAIVPLATCLLLNVKNKPKAYEKFSIFIGANVTLKDELHEEISNLLSEDLEVKIDAIKEEDKLFQTKLDTSGRTSDIVILSKTRADLEENDTFAVLNEDNKYYNETNFVKYDHHFGILVKEDCYLSKFVEFKDEPYYVLINQKTVHGEGYLENYSTNQIDRVLSLLLKEEKIDMTDYSNIENHIKGEIAQNRIAGASLLIYKDGKVIFDKNFGYANIEKGIKISNKTRFRLASMTKPVTAVAAMIAVEQGLFNLDDYAYKYLPETKDLSLKDENFNVISEEKYNFTIRQLLRHNAGFSVNEGESRAFTLFKDEDLHELKDCIKYVKDVGLQFIPGEKFAYSGTYAYNIVARIIEVTSNMKYEEFLKKYLFEPLDMKNISYTFNESDEKAISYKSNDGKLIYVDDLNRGFECYYPGYNSGGAGLICTKDDYSKFALMLLNKGKVKGVRVLKEESFTDLLKYEPTPNLNGGGIETFGLSFFVRDPQYSNWQKLPSGCFGWSGAYGTHFWVDPANNMYVIYMHNSSTFGGSGAPQHTQLESDVVEAFGLKR